MDVWRSVALACGFLAGTIALGRRTPTPTLVIGTIVQLEHGRLWVDVEYADPRSPRRRVEVTYRGALPVNVCRGYEAAVTGVADGSTLAAYEIAPVNMGRYDPCFAWRCFPGMCPANEWFR